MQIVETKEIFFVLTRSLFRQHFLLSKQRTKMSPVGWTNFETLHPAHHESSHSSMNEAIVLPCGAKTHDLKLQFHSNLPHLVFLEQPPPQLISVVFLHALHQCQRNQGTTTLMHSTEPALSALMKTQADASATNAFCQCLRENFSIWVRTAGASLRTTQLHLITFL